MILKTEHIQLIRLFEKVTHARVKHFFETPMPVFIVEEGELGRALGKQRANLLKVESLLKKRVKVVEYADSMLQFIANLIQPIKPVDIKEDNGIVTITGRDMKSRGLLIGKNAQNLRANEKIVKHFFPQLKEIKVV